MLSRKPIYGLVRLAPDPYQKESGTPLYFVADESGEKPPEKKLAEEPKEEASILETLSAALGIKKAATSSVEGPISGPRRNRPPDGGYR